MNQEEVNPRAQIVLLWEAKWLVSGVTLGFAILAAIAAFVIPKQYEAVVVMSPVSTSGAGGQMGALGSMASQFGGLAALAGISVTGDSGKSESIAVLQSESLTDTYIRQNGLLPVLFSKKWDAQRNTWKSQDPQDIPTVWKANKLFDESIRKVVINAKTGIVTLTITWREPKLAATWANGLVSMTNDYLRNKTIREAERNIDYLNGEAAKSNVVEVKQAVYSIMKTEINREMIARGSNEYAFKIIDPAVPPELASSPRKSLWVLVGLAVGLMVSVLVVFIRAGVRT